MFLTIAIYLDIITFTGKFNTYRGVAQLVARDVWDVDAAGSNPVTPTTDAALTAERAAK